MSTFVIEIKAPTGPTGQPAVFVPRTQECVPYDTITWHNADSQAHYPAPIIGGIVKKDGWFEYQIPPGGTSDTLAPGPSLSGPTGPTAGYPLNYACALHPNERGSIFVRNK